MALRPEKYDVFLSFRGKDTGSSFTDHLHAALVRKRVSTFRHDRLQRGEEIQAGLWKAIEESGSYIILFSENYASSRWCLDELVKIMESKRYRIVVPVFYKVNPSDVRGLKGSFGKAFARHESGDKEKAKVERWKAALTEAANLRGWHLENGHESEFIERIVKDILEKLEGRKYMFLFEDVWKRNSNHDAQQIKNSRQGQMKLRSKILNNMKFLHLRHTCHLTDSTALPGITSPVKLLNDCTSLVEVCQYIACLDKQLLNLEFYVLGVGFLTISNPRMAEQIYLVLRASFQIGFYADETQLMNLIDDVPLVYKVKSKTTGFKRHYEPIFCGNLLYSQDHIYMAPLCTKTLSIFNLKMEARE